MEVTDKENRPALETPSPNAVSPMKNPFASNKAYGKLLSPKTLKRTSTAETDGLGGSEKKRVLSNPFARRDPENKK